MKGIPQAASPIITKTGTSDPVWFRFFEYVSRVLNGREPLPLASYTVALLPDPADYKSHLIYVSDASGGAVPAFSDGTNWRRVTDRVIVT